MDTVLAKIETASDKLTLLDFSVAIKIKSVSCLHAGVAVDAKFLESCREFGQGQKAFLFFVKLGEDMVHLKRNLVIASNHDLAKSS